MATAKQLRDAALEEVETNANQEWKDKALQTIEYLAVSEFDEFTSDEVWEFLELKFPDVKTHQPSAMGAIIKKASSLGFIKPTKRFVESTRPSSHARPIRVWKSLI